jgi:hypothetical protein
MGGFFMRLFLIGLLLSTGAIAAEPTDDEILGDLVVITAAPRPVDVKMVVQTAKPSPAEKTVKAEGPAPDSPQDAAQPVKTAAK